MTAIAPPDGHSATCRLKSHPPYYLQYYLKLIYLACQYYNQLQPWQQIPGHGDLAHRSLTAHPAARSRMRSALAHGQSDRSLTASCRLLTAPCRSLMASCRSLTAPSRLYSNSTLRVCTCVATTPKAEKGGPAFVQSRHSTAHAPHSAHRSGEGACTACLHRITVYAYLTIYTYFPLTIAYSYSSESYIAACVHFVPHIVFHFLFRPD